MSADTVDKASFLTKGKPATSASSALVMGPLVTPKLDHETYPRIKWEHRKNLDLEGVASMGVLKLLLTEIQFLTKHASSGDTVVYIAGSQGSHLLTLARMFPFLQFHVYDMGPFPAIQLGEASNRFKFMARKLTQEDLKGYYGMRDKVLLLSDVKPLEFRGNRSTHTTVHTQFMEDRDEMNLQRSWVCSMKPRQALLRLRIPYNETDGSLGKRRTPDKAMSISYLDGEMFFQPFGRRSAVEMRLHLAPLNPHTMQYSTKAYDCQKHEECMLYHNAVIRRAHLTNFDPSVAKLASSPGLALGSAPLMTETDASLPIQMLGELQNTSNASPSAKTLSYDQLLAHLILREWVNRAMQDPSICAGAVGEDAVEYVRDVLREFDDRVYGQYLCVKHLQEEIGL